MCGFFIGGDNLNIFIYSDESGVFDKVHNDIFVFGGLIFLSKESKDTCCRKYTSIEKIMYSNGKASCGEEIKAAKISNEDKNKLYRSLNKYFKFGIVINQKKLLNKIFDSKKDKQRYLDYAYKTGIKHTFECMVSQNIIDPNDVNNMYFFVDEHTTATNGKYELREALEQELKNGTYNYNWSEYYTPVFPNLKILDLKYCNSAAVTLIRASDIVANKVLYIALNGNDYTNEINQRNMYLTYLP